METNKDGKDIYTKTIEGIEQITFVILLHETRFSFYCLKDFGWKERLLKPYVEDISFEYFDSLLDLYETAITDRTKGLWTVIQRSLKRSLLCPSPREEGAIKKKLYYERGFAPCFPPDDEGILQKIEELKNKDR